jgi:hypothetical protein
VRITNRVLAVAAALAVAAGGVIVAVEIALAGIGRSPWVVPYDAWYDSGRGNHWDSSGARVLFIALVAGGLALLVLQVVKAPPRSVALQGGRSQAGLSRRSLEQALAGTAGSLDGVSTAKASIHGDRARVVVATGRRTGDLGPRVEQAVQARLHSLGVGRPAKIVVDVKAR